jgi:hypothetical protein
MPEYDIELYKVHSKAVELFAKDNCKICSVEITFDCDNKKCNGRMFNHSGFELIESNWISLCENCYRKLKLGEEFKKHYNEFKEYKKQLKWR